VGDSVHGWPALSARLRLSPVAPSLPAYCLTIGTFSLLHVVVMVVIVLDEIMAG